ncbi:MAG: putative toxin-antitoxin system toxin component, PIN family [Marinilabiliaceae bacterium]|nr:putative toxin-antitoxin system toxin component, PIN family [Marinilabiliaceae bacterium]
MKIVLDTNCLLRAAPHKSDYFCILKALQKGRYVLCSSNEILLEYEELLTRFYSKNFANYVLNFLFYSVNTLLITPFFKWNLITSDLDDNKFVDCALNAGADYIVTNDNHFNILKSLHFPPIKVVNIETFKQILISE